MRLSLKPLGAVLLMSAVVAWLLPAAAQSMRDPTIPPGGFGTSDGQGGGAAVVRGLNGPLSVILVDGKFHLVVGTRLYVEGQKLGEARIERISETEVWLREGRELRKVSNFVGVKRRNVTDAATAPQPGCAVSAAKTSKETHSSNTPGAAVADCDRTQARD
jgi:hypothetical protein